MYVMTETTLGTGAVGGSLASVETFAKRAGELAQLVLTGTDIKSLPFEVRTDTEATFDWRALQRWGISESRLPPGSVVRFKPRSVWEQYQWYVIGGLILLFLQTAMIIDLLLQRHRRRRTEAILKENQELMELATSAGELGLWSRDLTHDGIWANEPMRALFGFGATDPLRLEDVLEHVHIQDWERMQLRMEHAETAEAPFEGEFRVIPSNGKERWVLAKGRTVVEPSGTRRMGVVLDITERKRAEEKFQSAIEASPNAILMVDDQGRIFLVNAQAERLFGYSRDELLGQSVEILVPERFRAEHPANWTAFRAAPETRTMGVGRELFGLCKDGREIPVEIGLSPIHAEEGLIILVTIIDISERKRSAEELERERSFLRQVIDTVPNFIFAKDREGRFTLANQAVADAYGTTVDDLIGKTDADFSSNKEEVEFFKRIDQEVIDSLQEHFIAEEHMTDAEGRVRWLQTVKRPIIESEGRAKQVLGASTDITRRRETEIELREQRAELAHVARISNMGELAASLAHELNQPLTAILSNAQAALRFLGKNPAELEEVREILLDIVKDNSRAGEVIRRMRALVKKEKIEFATVDLTGLIRDVVMLVHSDAILQNVKITLELKNDLSFVRGDKVQIQQVVLNLMLNAFDAMTGRPVSEREVKLRMEPDNSGFVQVAVSDCGTGLSSDKLDKIFQPFFTTKGEGLGMGLSICRSIIEAHRGRLWAENNERHGATFYFTLPVEGEDGRGK
jgi:PAS domain S-box-containing protein